MSFYVDTTLITTPDGNKVLILDTTYCGSIEDGERALKPLREFRRADRRPHSADTVCQAAKRRG